MSEVKSFIKMLLQIARRWDYILLYLLFRISRKADPEHVVMLSDSRQELSGNLWFIDRELKTRGYQPEYFLKKNLKARKTLKEKLQMCRAMAEAGVILVDDFYPLIYPIPLRKETRLIQVWHAMGAFKRVGFSRPDKANGADRFSITHRNYTDAIVSADAVRQNYAEAFRMDVDHVHATGIPRTDIFWDEQYIQSAREELYNRYPMLKGKKVILFAPTFRGTGQNTAHYNYDWLDFDRFCREFKDEYVCIVKMHPFIRQKPEKLDASFYLDLSEEREINDLLLITDVLITDYSSVIFEASLLGTNTVFFVPDLADYRNSRDFYYPFEDYTYGMIAKTMDELITVMQQAEQNQEKLNAFLQKFCSACDGHSTARFVDFFWKMI